MNETETGILIIAHGSSNPNWEKDIEHATSLVKTELPIVLSYLEFTEEKTIENGIRQLEEMGVETIVSIPLFISSGSTHIDEIKYALGLQLNTSVDTDLKPIKTDRQLLWCDPMDDHPYILDLLMQRIASLSNKPNEENLLLVAHGSDEPSFHVIWEDLLERIKQTISEHYHFQQVVHGTLHPDNLRETADKLANDTDLLVVPLFLCKGYFTNKVIPAKLAGLTYKWEGATYLPHPLVAKWIEDQVRLALTKRSYS